MAALDGVRVVDLTRYLSGPTLTMLLADLGAQVVKVEPLPAGDPARRSGPFDGPESVYYMASNRNKRSVAVDLRHPAGLELCLELVDGADVFVQNFRPGTAERMGLGPADLHARNPRLVYTSVSGFGQRPPGDALPGFDQTAQAMSGLMSVTGTPRTGPLRVGIAVADSATGVFGAVGVLAALLERERTGRGTVVEASLMESMLSLMSYQAQRYLSLGEVPGQDGNDHPIMFPQGTFRTAGGAVSLACGSDTMWARLCAVLDRPDLVDDARFATNADRMTHRVELRGILEGELGRRTAQEWVPVINAAGVPASPILDVAEALDHPVTESLRMVESVQHTLLGPMRVLGQAVKVAGSGDGWLRSAPPLFGEHTEQILAELGRTPEQIDALRRRGVVHQGRSGPRP